MPFPDATGFSSGKIDRHRLPTACCEGVAVGWAVSAELGRGGMPLAGPPDVGGDDPATCSSGHVVAVPRRCRRGSTAAAREVGDPEQEDSAELEREMGVKVGGDEVMSDRMKRFACSLEPARFTNDNEVEVASRLRPHPKRRLIFLQVLSSV